MEKTQRDYQAEYKKWLDEKTLDENTRAELLTLDEEAKKERFKEYMTFGTAGLRSKMGAGIAFMNLYTVAHATAGLAELIKAEPPEGKEGVAIAYDSRNNSDLFAERAAEVLTANGIMVYKFPALRPTPMLSFAVRHYECVAGIMITASHNPASDNGYKAYWSDGAQLNLQQAEKVAAEMAKIDIFDIEKVPPSDKKRSELVQTIGEDFDELYRQEVLAQRVNPEAIPAVADELKIVYTPLHGAGVTMVPEVLRRAGIKEENLLIVEEQKKPDGNFPTVGYPNPEEEAAFALGVELAKKNGADLIIATDPDSDRVGVCERADGDEFKTITGNQMGALLLNYIIEAYEEKDGAVPTGSYAVKSVVSANLAEKIAEAHKVEFYNVLTGFKFIGEVMEKNKNNGTFLLGFEESYGYLKGMYARDKDAVVASMLIAEMAAFYKKQRKKLLDVLEELFMLHGYHKEDVRKIEIKGADAKEKMDEKMAAIRNCPPKTLGGFKVVKTRDFDKKEQVFDHENKLPKTNMLYFVNENDDVFIIRPSGTEPKIKVYILACAPTREELDKNLVPLKADADEMFKEFEPKGDNA